MFEFSLNDQQRYDDTKGMGNEVIIVTVERNGWKVRETGSSDALTWCRVKSGVPVCSIQIVAEKSSKKSVTYKKSENNSILVDICDE